MADVGRRATSCWVAKVLQLPVYLVYFTKVIELLQEGANMNFKPVLNARYFTATEKYNEIDWNDFPRVVAAFKDRIDEWYIRPMHVLAQSSHNYNFAIMALNCLLLDTLSQYYYGKLKSHRETFKKFARENFPEFKQTLPNPIRINKDRLHDGADVLYAGYRCGILHEAHIALYGGIAGANGKVLEIHKSGHVKYDNGADCPSMIIEPYKLTISTEQFFNDYIKQLLDNTQKYIVLKDNFRKKFVASFGVKI